VGNASISAASSILPGFGVANFFGTYLGGLMIERNSCDFCGFAFETNAVVFASNEVINGAARVAEADPTTTSKCLSAENFSVHRSPSSTELLRRAAETDREAASLLSI
jgi:predicted MFS family arabinose efflux permease